MDRREIAVATVTWARSDEEAERLIDALTALVRIGLPVVAADRGDCPPFLVRLAGLDGLEVAVAKSSGLVAQAQHALARAGAFGTRFILYTEPDKLQFFESSLDDFLRCAPDDDEVGVVLAARSAASFATFPPMQRYTERVFNQLASEQLGGSGDYCYGPFLLHRALLDAVAHFPNALGWGWRPATFVAARQQGRRLVHTVGDRPCPPDQRDEDARERAHRIRQLGQNLLGLLP